MLNDLSDDVIYFVLKKLHKFKYLHMLFRVNKNINNKTQFVLDFHYNNMNKYLNIELNSNMSNIYELISNKLFNSKILNIKKINNNFYNSIKNLNISNFIKLSIIFNEYNNCKVKMDYVKIINYKDLLQFFEYSDCNFFPFMILFLHNNITIFIEYDNNKKIYRLKLKYKNNDVSIFKPIDEVNLFNLFILSKKQILELYL
jgi:ribosomal protein S8